MPIAYIGLGSNLPSPVGPSPATLARAVERMTVFARVVSCSPLYSTSPVGLSDQPRFVNAAVALETELSPVQLLGAMLLIESDFGRDRSLSIPNGPRTLDLDVLLYEDFVVNGSILKLPHPRMAERAFVLVPLAEIAPEAVVVTLGATVKQLLHTLRNGLPAEIDAILPLQSDLWNAAPCLGADLPAGSGAPDPDHHG
jgi:2-amino-4-hydroxy-6-hydroxymethyldihydropteridine diphosphokinase